MSKPNRRSDESAIEQRKADGYINATRLCKIHNERTGEGKLPKHWLETKSSKSITEKLSLTSGIPLVKLVETKEGKNGGTWIHPRLAVRFTMWLDEEFSLQVEDLVQEWLTTETSRKANQSSWSKVREEGKITRRTAKTCTPGTRLERRSVVCLSLSQLASC